MRPLFLLFSVLLSIPALGQADTPCPVTTRYCQAGPAEVGRKLDLAPAQTQAQMRQQFLPQCEQAMVQGMGTSAKPVSKAFCTCSVDAILATPGEWRVLRSTGGQNPKTVQTTHRALAEQTRNQEKACMYAIAKGTGLIAPRSAVGGPAPSVPAPTANPGDGNPLAMPGQPLPPSQNPNFSGGTGLLGAPYLPDNQR